MMFLLQPLSWQPAAEAQGSFLRIRTAISISRNVFKTVGYLSLYTCRYLLIVTDLTTDQGLFEWVSDEIVRSHLKYMWIKESGEKEAEAPADKV